MTPKEKAEQLVGQLKIPLILSDTDAGEEIICTGISKHCALIAVDEIIKAIDFDWMEVQNLDREHAYWNEVKQEIEKL